VLNKKVAVENKKYLNYDLIRNSDLSVPGAENISTSYCKELIETEDDF